MRLGLLSLCSLVLLLLLLPLGVPPTPHASHDAFPKTVNFRGRSPSKVPVGGGAGALRNFVRRGKCKTNRALRRRRERKRGWGNRKMLGPPPKRPQMTPLFVTVLGGGGSRMEPQPWPSHSPTSTNPAPNLRPPLRPCLSLHMPPRSGGWAEIAHHSRPGGTLLEPQTRGIRNNAAPSWGGRVSSVAPRAGRDL